MPYSPRIVSFNKNWHGLRNMIDAFVLVTFHIIQRWLVPLTSDNKHMWAPANISLSIDERQFDS